MDRKPENSPISNHFLFRLLVPLCAILFLVWVIILGEFVVIAGWIVEIPDPIGAGEVIRFLVAVGKVGLAGLLGIGWLYVWNWVVRFYFKWAMKNNRDVIE